jgi:SAM-dependent methyltransferase
MPLAARLEALRSQHGAWSAHNIELAPGLFTIQAAPPDRAQQRAQLYAGLCRTLLRRPLRGLRVLDLGCLEGGISIALARQGARCLGIDVRTSHLAKAAFAAQALGLQRRCRWLEGDVTDPSLWQRLGRFDLVICSGLLYHLDAADLLPLLKRLHGVCRRRRALAIVDTNIAPAPSHCVELPGQPPLWGCHWQEHEPSTSEPERLAAGWSSLHNNQAFWLTERSLVNALVSAGFGSVVKPLYPYHEWGHQTRDVWLALPAPADPAGLPLRSDPDPRPWAHPGLP